MARLDMTAFPELRNMSSERERAANYARSRRSVEPGTSDVIVHFWSEVAERLQDENDLSAMATLLGELERDIDLLRALRETHSGARDNPAQLNQLTMLARMLQLLLDLLTQFKKRHWELRERALRYYLMLNPAIPSKAREKMEQEKEKDADKKTEKKKEQGQAEAKRALDESRKPAKPTPAPEREKQRQPAPEKKMSP